MDQAVLDAYGWTDLVPSCEFLLDYEEDEDDEGGSSRRKKPWRYRWPDDVRDEVLARLLDLNTQRAEEERLTGLAAEANGTKRGQPTALPSERRHTATAPARRGAPPAGLRVIRAVRIVTSTRGRAQMEPVHVRHQLVEALRLDLVGPEDGSGTPRKSCPSARRPGI